MSSCFWVVLAQLTSKTYPVNCRQVLSNFTAKIPTFAIFVTPDLWANCLKRQTDLGFLDILWRPNFDIIRVFLFIILFKRNGVAKIQPFQ